jgi:hydroxypyruvate reductase
MRDLFAKALTSVQVETELQQRVRCDGSVLVVDDMQYDLADFSRIALVSIGKAAVPMCSYFAQILRSALRGGQQIEGVTVGAALSARLPEGIRYFAGSHPIPNGISRDAAVEIMKLLHSLDEHSLVLFLISGGGSAMVEMPIDSSVSVEDTAEFYKALLHSGLSIVEMNILRKHFSAVKGGRMAEAAGEATQCTVLVCDVPEDALNMVSSGPSLPDTSTTAECLELIASRNLENVLPDRVMRYLRSVATQETPQETSAVFSRSRWTCLLSNERLLDCAARLAEDAGYKVVIDNTCDDWDYRKAADYLLNQLKILAGEHTRVCLLSGGEVGVEICGAAGVGGRNQQFALYCATQIGTRFQGQYVSVLSAGSDGIDGNSASAGAVADWTTVQRAQEHGMDPLRALQEFNSGKLFEELGDAIVTGPTGNNLRDIRMLLSTE